MKELEVYADFNWLDKPERIGRLSCEFLRGTETYGFEFDNKWLSLYNNLILSDDLNNYPGKQYTKQGKQIFGCFSDALPDRWGRTLLNRREQILAKKDKRPVHRLSSFDYLTGIDDFSRMGGFRFKEPSKDVFINENENLKIPPLTGIRDLIYASQEVENSEQQNILPQLKWINQLIQPGTSLGGARPKASVIDENKNLYVAKFPSKNDTYDVALWEHLCHLLAKKAGINTAKTSVLNTDNKYHTLLSKRFDRSPHNPSNRIHFASAMTLLGLTDGSNAGTGNGYPDIVDFILQGCTQVENNLRELYKRVAFNICVGNTDDHFRNHGFLLTKKGWTLSPDYDINPTLNNQQSILISASSCESDLDILSDASEEYMLDRDTASKIISDVLKAIKDWKSMALRLQIKKHEIDYFSQKFDRQNTTKTDW